MGRRKRPFWDFVDKGSAGCWPYRGAITGRGYGSAWFRGRMLPAHRVAWILTHGPIPHGLLVCHRCDNPPCVNPAHLFLGTASDNMRDMIAKGRERRALGSRAGKSRLTENAVRELRRLYAAGVFNQPALARKYGVSQQAISKIVRGEWWRHVDGIAVTVSARTSGVTGSGCSAE